MKKLRVGILFGGQSAEHEVSVLSAKNVLAALDRKKYVPVLIGLDRRGRWSRWTGLQLKTRTSVRPIRPNENYLPTFIRTRPVDVVFPVLHGPFGEDGTVQGLLKSANIPFVGADVIGSAVGMDKDVQKRLLQQAGLPVAKFLVLHRAAPETHSWLDVKKIIGLPCFVKPANLGSSVGVHKVHTAKEFQAALKDAFRFDRKILVEQFIAGREIECGVIGNDRQRASVPGAVIPRHSFYSYQAKYLDENGALLVVPAVLPKSITKKIQRMAIDVFTILECRGLARVDFFLTKRGQIVVNEINTLPGFTNISMFPRLWAASGLPLQDLIDRLITLALQNHRQRANLRASYT